MKVEKLRFFSIALTQALSVYVCVGVAITRQLWEHNLVVGAAIPSSSSTSNLFFYFSPSFAHF